MKKNGAVDIICKIVSVLLSIILVPMIIVTVLFASVNNLIQPDTLVKIITDIDYTEILEKATGEAYILEDPQQMGATEKVTPKTAVATTKLKPQNMMSLVPSKDKNEDSYNGNSFYVTNPDGSTSSGVISPDMGAGVDVVGREEYYENMGGGESGNSYVVEEERPTASVKAPSQSQISGTFGDIGSGIDGFIGDIAGDIGVENAEKAGEMVEDFLKTDVAQEIFGEYAQAVSDCIAGDENAQVDEEKIVEIIIENKDEIFDFVEEYTGQEIDRRQVGEVFDQIVQENVGVLIENLPAPQEIVANIPTEIIDVINFINNKVVLNFLILVDCVLVVLIFVLRLWDFAGFLWLSVNGIVSGVILAIIYGAISFIKSIALGAVPELESVLNSFINNATSKLLWGFIIILVASAVLMTLFFVIKSLRKNKQNF